MSVITGQQPNLREPAGWRRTKNRIATVLMVVSFVLVVIPLVFVLMGPLMVVGSYYAVTGGFDRNLLVVSIPVGLLITNVLVINNLRSRIADGAYVGAALLGGLGAWFVLSSGTGGSGVALAPSPSGANAMVWGTF